MDFVGNITIYYTRLLDWSLFITYFFFSLSIIILDWPKEKTRKNIWLSILKGVVAYGLYIVFESLIFGLVGSMGTYGGLLFSISFTIIPLVYFSIFIKKPILQKIAKIEIMVALFLAVAQLIKEFQDVTQPLPSEWVFISYIARILPYAFIVVYSFVMKKYDISRFSKMTKSQFILVTVLAVSLSLATLWQSMIKTEDDSIHWFLIAASTASLIVLIQMYYTMYSVMDKRHRITSLEVQSSILELEKDSLNIDIRNREELMKIRHDLKNQLSYINVLLNENKYDEARKYLTDLLEQKEDYLESFSCPNTVISGIVNLELTKAKIANKKIKFRAVVPPRLPFDDADLLSLITNIADNCLENFVPEDEKDRISISILTQQDYLRIVSYNTIADERLKQEFSLHTTKRDKNHGYGTKIIKNICEKYHGYATFNIDGNKFVCDCVLDMTYRSSNNA